MAPHVKGAALALVAFAIYSAHDVVIKSLGGAYSPFQIIFFSGLLGFPLVSVMLLMDKTDGNLIARHPGWSLLRAATAVVTGVLGFFAFSVLPLAQTYSILFAMPLLITLLAIPMLGETVGPRRATAVAIGLIGVLVVLRPGTTELSLGHAAALAAAFLAALGAVIVRKIGGVERSAVLLLYPMIGSFLTSAAALPFVYVPMPITDLALTGVIAAMGFAATMLIIQAYRLAPAAIVAPMQYSQMLWAVVYGALFFDETPDRWTAIGASVIILSGIYILKRERMPSVSRNAPVLSTKSRPETGLMPRISLLLTRGDKD